MMSQLPKKVRWSTKIAESSLPFWLSHARHLNHASHKPNDSLHMYALRTYFCNLPWEIFVNFQCIMFIFATFVSLPPEKEFVIRVIREWRVLSWWTCTSLWQTILENCKPKIWLLYLFNYSYACLIFKGHFIQPSMLGYLFSENIPCYTCRKT